jgi:hypothetical protein
MTESFEDSLLKMKSETLKTIKSNLNEMLSQEPKKFVEEKELITNNPLSPLSDHEGEDSSRILRDDVEDLSTDNNSSGKETIKKPEYVSTGKIKN